MTDALKLFALVAVGVALGWWLNGRGPIRTKVGAHCHSDIGRRAARVACSRDHDQPRNTRMDWRALADDHRSCGSAAGIGCVAGSGACSTQAEPVKDTAPMKRDKPARPSRCRRVHQHCPLASCSLFAAAGVASGFWVVIALGFRLHGQSAPAGLDQGLIPAVLVLIATVSLGLRAVWRHRGWRVPVFSARREAREQAEAVAKRQAWLAAMAADPRRQRYAAMVEAGDNFWTPERVEYDLDPHATACCEHFAPIESAMRAAGLKVRLGGPSTVSAECVVDPDALAQKFPLPEGIGYQEWYSRDRSGDDPPHALLFCQPITRECGWCMRGRLRRVRRSFRPRLRGCRPHRRCRPRLPND